MVNHNDILFEDIQKLGEAYKDCFNALNGKTILVTGATGLIGKTVVLSILKNTKKAKVIAHVRNQKKAETIFANEIINESLSFIVSDITESIPECGRVDYIVHAASETSSKAFVDKPVETINVALRGTANVLEFARKNNVEGVIYLSTMEVYGAPVTDEKIDESHATNLDSMAVRSSYPESKRMCESLCKAYAFEYFVPVKVMRLTQTFGPGVLYDDGRVFAEFARCTIEKKNIVLHTKGETKRNYLYTTDAVSAILVCLLKGKTGEAYNVANESTYCSIYDMASLVANEIANKTIQVVVEESDAVQFGYAPPLKMNLDTAKLQNLGWAPKYNLKEMFSRMILSMEKTSLE